MDDSSAEGSEDCDNNIGSSGSSERERSEINETNNNDSHRSSISDTDSSSGGNDKNSDPNDSTLKSTLALSKPLRWKPAMVSISFIM